MRRTEKIDFGQVDFECGENVEKRVYDTVLDWFLENELFDGESVTQSDVGHLEAPELISDLADRVFKFNPEYNE